MSVVGLVGGGQQPRPGEISLAHHGVLFLDELPSSRGPRSSRCVSLWRNVRSPSCGRCSVTYPASFSLIAAMNPCPCGFRGSSLRTCRCDLRCGEPISFASVGPIAGSLRSSHRSSHVDYQTLLDARRSGVSSASVRDQVMAAGDATGARRDVWSLLRIAMRRQPRRRRRCPARRCG